MMRILWSPLLLLLCLGPLDAQNALDEAARRAAQGDHDGAVRLYREALQQPDAPAAVHAGLAQALLYAGQTEAALAAARLGVADHPEDPRMLRAAAGVHAAQGQYADAIGHLQEAIRLDPGHAEDHANLGGLYTALGRFDEALPSLQEAARLNPDSAVAQQRLGLLHLRREAFAAAAERLSQAARLDSLSATTAYLLGQALEGQQDLPAALARFQQATRLDPSYLDAHYRTARLARRLQQTQVADEALAAYRRLQNIGDGDADTLKRFRLLRDAVLESGDQPEHLFALATFLLAEGYLDEAENRLLAVVRKRPDHAQAHNQLGNVHLRRRDPDRALLRYEEAVRLAPDFVPAALNAGNACMLLRQPGRAIPHYERVVRLAPNVPMGWLGLASAHLESRRPDVALSVLDQGLKAARPEGRMKNAFLDQQRKARAQTTQ